MSCQKYVDAKPEGRVRAMVRFINQHLSQLESAEAGSVEFHFTAQELKSSIRIYETSDVKKVNISARQ
jgi:hypothetical protein